MTILRQRHDCLNKTRKRYITGLMNHFRKNVISEVCKHGTYKRKTKNIDNKIALGVILRSVGVVAEADKKFLPEEIKKIKQILLSRTKISKQDFPIVLSAIRQFAIGRNNLYRFVREISKKLRYNVKKSIIEDLFHVGYADRDLDNNEFKVIRKVSGLLNVADKDFTDIWQRIELESGLSKE